MGTTDFLYLRTELSLLSLLVITISTDRIKLYDASYVSPRARVSALAVLK